jgi:DNA-binding transcriptional MerR regulator
LLSSSRQRRFYDQLGLLHPARTDGQTGYRYYSVRQLPRLNCILALKELGLLLEQIGPLLKDEISPSDGRGPCGNREPHSIHAGAIQIGNDERPFARSSGTNQIHPPRCSIVVQIFPRCPVFLRCGQPGNISAVSALLPKSSG